MRKLKKEKLTQTTTPQRRLSLFRVLIAVLILGASIYYVATNWIDLKDKVIEIVIASSTSTQFYAPYVDVTATPTFEFEKLGNTTSRNVVLSFIVASKEDACLPTWGTAYNLDQASVGLDLDRRIARLRQLGGDISISFGGLLNNELAVGCTDLDKLKLAYKSVIEKYNVFTLDLDIEGNALNDTSSNIRRAEALYALQQEYKQDNKNLAIWLTLPVTTNGLTEAGTNFVSTMLNYNVNIAGVNAMTMNFGDSKDSDTSMAQASIKSLNETHRQLGILYRQSGTSLSSTSLWKKIGATPMIGQNDFSKEVFRLSDAKTLNEYILSQGIIRTSMWSINRDRQCGENYANVNQVSDSCSGTEQNALDYSVALANGLTGNFIVNQNNTTKESSDKEVLISDDPENSPYRIWGPTDVYIAGTKVVWKRNVYQAKWWTQGENPDNPVLQAWQTPWQLIGPVLPGEKPVEQPTLPDGTYPEWDSKAEYQAGDRILFNKVPFQAKWWTHADNPSVSIANPAISPWVQLNITQIEEILKSQNK